jgi:septal ring factor EnvC (AmiA/AmiB activator)
MDEKDVRIENLERQLSEVKENEKDFEKRLTLLERNTAVSEEQIKMIYKILNEIKDSIASIAKKLDVIEQEPAKEASQIKVSVIASFLSAVAGAVAVLLFKN